jgi:hypothetical protein
MAAATSQGQQQMLLQASLAQQLQHKLTNKVSVIFDSQVTRGMNN